MGLVIGLAAIAAVQAGIVDDPCGSAIVEPAAVPTFREMLLNPGKIDVAAATHLLSTPEVQRYNAVVAERAKGDWANLCRYAAENRRLIQSGKRIDAVFIGDSITENWAVADPDLFSAGVVGRGISGQTTPQILLRFRADVVALHPRVVHILAGTNDVAGNTGPSSEQMFRDNIISMVEIARANRIKVVIGSIPPARRFFWRPEIANPPERIATLNAWLRDYARRERLLYVDYHAALATPDGALPVRYGNDGVHPNRDGYAVMKRLASDAIRKK